MKATSFNEIVDIANGIYKELYSNIDPYDQVAETACVNQTMNIINQSYNIVGMGMYYDFETRCFNVYYEELLGKEFYETEEDIAGEYV